MFNFLKKKPTIFGTLHGMDLRDWNDGYKEDTKKLPVNRFQSYLAFEE